MEHPLTEEDLDDLRNLLGQGVTLPAGFETFMRMYNGGSFDESIYLAGPVGPVIINTCNSISKADPESIQAQLPYVREQIGSNLLPFADDPGGNCFLVGYGHTNHGRVYFWDHHTGELTELSESFDSFIDALVVFDPNDTTV